MIDDPQYVIFRDDDLGLIEGPSYTDLYTNKFKFVHELYNKHRVIHEIGYITGNQESQKALTEYIRKQENIIIQFHAHNHCDFTRLSADEIHSQFKNGIKVIEDVFGKKPSKWYPPHHKFNDLSVKISIEHGLIPATEVSMSLKRFVETGKLCFRPNDPISICHHYWSDDQTEYLECALLMYRTYMKAHIKENSPKKIS